MLLDILWVIAVWTAIVVFFVFYLAFAYLLFSPLLDYLIEQAFRAGLRHGPRVRRHHFEAHRLTVREWPHTCMVEDEEPEFRATVTY